MFDKYTAVLVSLTGVLFLFIGIPIFAIFVSLPTGNIVAESLDSTTLKALQLSFVTTLASLGIIVALGIPAARLLSRTEFRGKKILDSLIDIPIVLPPSVAGIALLLAFAPVSPIGHVLQTYGLIIPGTIFAVILAQTFVALPFFVRSARTAFEEIDPGLETAANILSPSRAYVFRTVVLPLASRGILAGAVLSWGRALGEFGATLMFAGNNPGITQTMPLAIYVGLQTDLYRATFLSAILIVISFAIILIFRRFEPRRAK